MNINDIEKQNIDLLIQKEKLIILEFYTKWCPTCKMVAMNLEEYHQWSLSHYLKKVVLLFL